MRIGPSLNINRDGSFSSMAGDASGATKV
jgi:hypothetical protein